MSGPKIDHVELERRRQAEIERLRQERLRRIREETNKLNAEISATTKQVDFINEHLCSLIRSIESKSEMEITIKNIGRVKESHKKKLLRLLEEIVVPTEPDDISIYTHELSSKVKAAVADYLREVAEYEERINDFIRQSEIKPLAGFNSIVEQLAKMEDFDFSFKKAEAKSSKIEPSVKERATKILFDIERLLSSESIQESDMKKLVAIANSIYESAFESGASFEASVVEYGVAKSKTIRSIAVFDEIYLDYYAEYVTYIDLLNKHGKTAIEITPKEKYRFESVEALQHELTFLAKESKKTSMNNYIREQIDDVMQMFGYYTTEEIVFNPNHTGSHFICESESGRPAIHVHVSEKKQIMMQIVATEKSSRAGSHESISGIISESSDLSTEERNQLLLEQGRFCDLHPKIVDELKKRGLKLDAKSRKAPDEKHCKKILRVSSAKSSAAQTEAIAQIIHDPKATQRPDRKKGLKEKRREMK